MVRDKYRDALICTSVIVAGLVGAVMFLPLAIVCANPGPDSAASGATFRSGEVRNVPWSRWIWFRGWKEYERSGSSIAGSAKIARCGTRASDGQGGMPSFQGSLSDDQIQSLVTQIRSLHQKK
jgi:hypothetical protein